MTLNTYPRQDLFESSLLSDIGSSDTSITLNNAPSFALTNGQSCYIHVDYDNSAKYEPMLVTAIIGANLTVTRGIAKYEGGASTAVTHASGAKVRFSVGWKDFSNFKTEIDSKASKAGDTFTGAVKFSGATATLTLPNLTQSEINALTPEEGMKVKNVTTGTEQTYIGGVWLDAGTSTTPNASQTVAGKVEIATTAEIDAGTSAGSTGALLGVNPANLASSKYSSQLPTSSEKAYLTNLLTSGVPAIKHSKVTVVEGIYGEIIAADKLVYKSMTDNKWYKVNSASLPAWYEYGITMESGVADEIKNIHYEGDYTIGSYSNINPTFAFTSGTESDHFIQYDSTYALAGQNFNNTTGAECVITSVTIKARKVGSPTSDLYVAITMPYKQVSDATTQPSNGLLSVSSTWYATNHVLSSKSMPYSSITTGDTDLTFTFASPVKIPAGCYFSVIVYTPSATSTSNYYVVKKVTSSTPPYLNYGLSSPWSYMTGYNLKCSLGVQSTSPIGYSVCWDGTSGGIDIRKSQRRKILGTIKSANTITFSANNKRSVVREGSLYEGFNYGPLKFVDTIGGFTPSEVRITQSTASAPVFGVLRPETTEGSSSLNLKNGDSYTNVDQKSGCFGDTTNVYYQFWIMEKGLLVFRGVPILLGADSTTQTKLMCELIS